MQVLTLIFSSLSNPLLSIFASVFSSSGGTPVLSRRWSAVPFPAEMVCAGYHYPPLDKPAVKVASRVFVGVVTLIVSYLSV